MEFLGGIHCFSVGLPTGHFLRVKNLFSDHAGPAAVGLSLLRFFAIPQSAERFLEWLILESVPFVAR